MRRPSGRQPGGLREPAAVGLVRGRSSRRAICASRPSARARCVSSPSKGWTAAPAAARTCAPPERSGHPAAQAGQVRNTVRVEFLCGGRAVARAQADFDALPRGADVFRRAGRSRRRWWRPSGGRPRSRKTRRKLEAGSGAYQGRELYSRLPRRTRRDAPPRRTLPPAATWRICAPWRRASPRNPFSPLQRQ